MKKVIVTRVKEYDLEISWEDFEDILDVAVFLITYWAKSASIELIEDDSDEVQFVVIDDEDVKHLITKDIIEDAIITMVSPGSKVSNVVINDILDCADNNSIGSIDATTADCIIQFACFGETVYA